MRRGVAPHDQMDLLAWEPPPVVVAFAPERVRGASLAARIARAVAETLADADRRGLTRGQIAARMSDYLGERVSLHMLNAYASVARGEHAIGVARMQALLRVTEDRRLLELLAEECGWAVIERRHLALIDLAAVHEAGRRLARREQALRRAARAGGAL